jgi:hypothetical protein
LFVFGCVCDAVRPTRRPAHDDGVIPRAHASRDSPGMHKRIAASLLWAITIYSGWELGYGMYGIPREIGPVLCLIVAAILLVDPGNFIWKTSTPARRVATIPEPNGAGQTATLPR